MVHHPKGLSQCGYLWKGEWCTNPPTSLSFCLWQESLNLNVMVMCSDSCLDDETNSLSPVGLWNTSSGVWQTLLISLWLNGIIKRLGGIVCMNNFTQHTHVKPLYRQRYLTFLCVCVHIIPCEYTLMNSADTLTTTMSHLSPEGFCFFSDLSSRPSMTKSCVCVRACWNLGEYLLMFVHLCLC